MVDENEAMVDTTPGTPCVPGRPRGPRKTPSDFYLAPDELGALLGAVRARRHKLAGPHGPHYVLLYLLGNLGLRVSECLALRVQDFDHDAETVGVRTLKRKRPRYDLLAVHPEVLKLVRRYVKAHGLRPEDYLFPGKGRSAHLTRQAADKAFRYYARRAGLKGNRSCHSLRHLRGSAVYAATHDPVAVQTQLRHASLRHTSRYIHLSPQRQREIAAAVPVVG